MSIGFIVLSKLWGGSLEEDGRRSKTCCHRAAADDVAKAAAKGAKIKKGDPAQPINSTSGKRHFEFSEGGSNKFWQIEISAKDVTTTWGRIGSDGQAS